MKNIIILFALVVLFSCKKEEPVPVEPDYAPDLVGTYNGEETQASPAVGNYTHINNTKTMTVTIIKKNVVLLSTFNGGSSMDFILSDAGGGVVGLKPTDPMETYGASSNNSYDPATKTIRVHFKNPNAPITYFYFQGVKQ